MSCHCQQYELYAAEAGLERGREFASPAELQTFLDDLRENAWWERFYPQVLRVEGDFVDTGKGSVGGFFPDRNSGRIEMGPGHRCELIVCHELAHVLAGARYRSASHDPWFARVYIELVYFIMGSEASTALRASFDEHNIQHDPAAGDFEWGRTRFQLGAATC